MNQLRSISFVLGLGLVSAAALMRDAHAAPNYYSQAGTTKVDARIGVVSPKGGQFEPGAALTIAWEKRTPDPQIQAWLYTATADGLRAEKVRYLAPPTGASSNWTAAGGSFEWKIPEDLPRGRYAIVILAGTDEATSQAFVIADPAAKMMPPRVEAGGLVKSAALESKGAKGSVRLLVSDKEVEYVWGKGQCPTLVGGIPGALATLAALGNVTIVPIVRDVIRKSHIEQTCLDGFSVSAPTPAVSALTATLPTSGSN